MSYLHTTRRNENKSNYFGWFLATNKKILQLGQVTVEIGVV